MLVLIGSHWSHSLCNSFVVNQFLFFLTPNGENSLCYTPKKQWEQYGGEKKNFCLFFISKIYSHVKQKWRPKTGMVIPTACVGSYFIPDENIQTYIYLICIDHSLEHTHTHTHTHTQKSFGWEVRLKYTYKPRFPLCVCVCVCVCVYWKQNQQSVRQFILAVILFDQF